jgi:hypothetical protein
MRHIQQLAFTSFRQRTSCYSQYLRGRTKDLSYGRFYQRLLSYRLLGIFIGGILSTGPDVLNRSDLRVELMYHSTAYIFMLSLTLRPKFAAPNTDKLPSAPFTSTVFILAQNLNVTETVLSF